MVHAWNQYARPSFIKDGRTYWGWACSLRPISSFPSHGCPFMDEVKHTFGTPSVSPSSIGVVHGKGQLSGIFFFFLCHVSQFNWLPVVSINFFEVEPRVISWLVCVVSYAQVSCLYIVEFLRYPLHLQNFLLWHSLSKSLCIHRLLSSRSRYFLFFLSLGF